jgi:hypothetical protein
LEHHQPYKYIYNESLKERKRRGGRERGRKSKEERNNNQKLNLMKGIDAHTKVNELQVG